MRLWLSGAEPSAEPPQQAPRMLNQVNLAVTTEQNTTVARIFNSFLRSKENLQLFWSEVFLGNNDMLS